MLVHDGPLIHRDDGIRHRRAVAQCTVWSLRVVVFPPFFDDDLCLLQGVEDFSIQRASNYPISNSPWINNRPCSGDIHFQFKEPGIMSSKPKLYLAGPDVFRSDAIKHADTLRQISAQHGFDALFPLDAEVEPTGIEPWEVAQRIYEANISLIHDCDAVVANMSPFRGPNMDAGTAFEIGYAHAHGKLIVGYTNDNRDIIERVTEFYQGHTTKSGEETRDPDGNLIEDFEGPENLMVTCPVIDVVDDFEIAVRLLAMIREETPDLF